MPQQWTPPTPVWEPPTSGASPVWTPPKVEEPSFIKRMMDKAGDAWSSINTPTVDFSKDKTTTAARDQFSKDHPIIGPVASFGADTLASMSSPLSLGLAGAGIAGEVGSKLPAIAKLARGTQEAATAGMVGHGTYKTLEGESGPERLGGILEAAGGLVGYRHAAKASLEAQGKLSKVGEVSSAQPGTVKPVVETIYAKPEEVKAYTDKGYVATNTKPDGTVVMKSPDSFKPAIPFEKPIPPPIPDDVMAGKKMVIDSLKEAKPLVKAQVTINSIERGRRIDAANQIGKATSGEAGFRAEKSALAGDYPKVEFESIRDKVDQKTVDTLLDHIKDHPELNDYEKIRARDGMAKLLGPEGGSVPQPNELKLLKTVFGDDLVKAATDKTPAWTKFKQQVTDVANVPRSLMASYDLSAPFRQGAFMVGRKEFWTSFDDMVKSFGSEKSYKAVQDNVRSNPKFELGQKSGLYLSDLMGDREEQFASDAAEKIPYIGRGVRASGRAYTAFINKLRMDTYSSLMDQADGLKLDASGNKGGLSDEIANYVNTATGRGQLASSIANNAKAINAVFFSPRLMSSRLTLLNPVKYVQASPFVRKEMLSDLVKMGGIGSTVAGLAKLGGAEIETDPTQTDFGKIKNGNTRTSLFGGHEQYIRAGAQLGSFLTSTAKNAVNPDAKNTIAPVEFGRPSEKDKLYRFMENKEAPLGSFVTTIFGQKDFDGKPIQLNKEIEDRLIPMLIQDVRDIAKDDPSKLPLAIPSALGVGVQTYQSGTSRQRPRIGAPRLSIPR